MEEAIRYYYNIQNIEILENNCVLIFKYLNNDFVFAPLERNIKDIKFWMNNNELRLLGLNYHKIIMNRFSNAVSSYNNKDYVLLGLMDNLTKEVDMSEMIVNSKKCKLTSIMASKMMSNWADLWERKIDYVENQIKVFGNSNQAVIHNTSYYIGLAENAIKYYRGINKPPKIDLTIAHRRVFFPNIWLNYGNPLSFVFDIPIRDYAEYIKSTFFYDSIESGYENFDFLLKIEKMDKCTLELLLSRLLFPSYYFDVFEDIILGDIDEKKLLTIIDRADDYEKFLKYCYKTVQKIININKFPDWLL